MESSFQLGMAFWEDTLLIVGTLRALRFVGSVLLAVAYVFRVFLPHFIYDCNAFKTNNEHITTQRKSAALCVRD